MNISTTLKSTFQEEFDTNPYEARRDNNNFDSKRL